MLSAIFLLFVLALIVVGIFGFISVDEIGSIWFTIIGVVLFIAPVVSHNGDVSTLKHAEEIIEITESSIQRINSEMKELTSGGALVNADTPIKTLAETKSEYVKELLKTRRQVLEAKMSIEQRKRGFTAYAVGLVE